jgi:D-apionolactonase
MEIRQASDLGRNIMNAAPSRAVMLCGTEQTDPPPRVLRAGPLSAEFENGALRYVRFGSVEVLRGVAFLVRDENWGTFTPAISDLKIEEGPESFAVSYRAVCRDAQRCLICAATISGKSDGALVFAVTAQAETDVLTNRTGFVVLHPAALAGRPVRVSHVDGRAEMARFPELISPGQPLLDIRALDHEISPGVWASVRMEGDGFEMEDQRNWGDASYKTYVGSLLEPWPYTLAKGSRHTQSVRLSIAGAGSHSASAGERDAPVAVAVAGEFGVMPAFGVGVPAAEAPHAVAALDLLRRLGPRRLVCHVDLRDAPPRSTLEAYRLLGEATGAELDLEIVIPDGADADDALGRVAAALAEARLEPASVSATTAADLLSWQPGQDRPMQPTPEAICAAARTAFPRTKLGGGMLSYFTELNRKRPPADLVDHVGHTTCPIVHAADDRSVMETLEALPAIIASTRALVGGKPYRVGPSAIGCRDNPYGAAPFENPDNGRVCLARVDPRQRGLFAAAYMLGYAAACAHGGVAAVALGAPTGPFGFIHRRADRPVPYFEGLTGPAVYPAFHVMAALAGGSGRPLLATTVSPPGVVAALAWREDGRRVVWLANLTAAPVRIALSGLPQDGARMAMLDASSFERATRDPDALDASAADVPAGPIRLDAYAVARLA